MKNPKRTKRAVWVSYDLGINGDYESLYAWLDNHNARECGDSLAFIEFETETDVVAELKADLTRSVELGRRSRIYVIYKQGDKVKGTFVAGGRKKAPWTGYGDAEEADTADEV